MSSYFQAIDAYDTTMVRDTYNHLCRDACAYTTLHAYVMTFIAASIWLTCHAEECTLEITPTGRGGGVEVEFARRQLIQAQAIKVDATGKFVKLDDSNPFVPLYRNKKYKGNKKTYQKDLNSGPDKEGNFDSYHLVLQPGKSDNVKKEKEGVEDSEDDDKVEESDFEAIKDYTTMDNEGHLLISMRRFNLGQTRRRTRTVVNKVDTYIKRRRDKLVIKENASLSVWGILQLVIGLFVFLLTILLGQFMEESKPRRHGGPGARRQQCASKTTPAKSNLKYRASSAGVRQQTTIRKNY